MFDIVRKEMQWGGETLTLETGRIARQADGCVLATLGETTVMAAVTFEKQPKVGFDFFPLTVHYIEKTYAAGKIPGGFFKREARPSEKETLTSRVICTVMSHDLENDPDMVAMIAASAALTISGAPFMGPIGGARIGYKDGGYLLNPSKDDLEDSKLELVMAGTKDAVMMVESEAQELSEEEMLGAVMFGHEQIQGVIDLIISLAEASAKEPFEVVQKDNSALMARVKEIAEAPLRDAFSTIDGRDLTTVRAIDSQVGVLPRTHGSALFTRGETQSVCVTTLGTGDDEQIMDALDGEYRERFLLHYNFPPYSVGEAGRMGPPGRREIGHGKLAWRALRAVLPAATDFPYTIRLVSEITESR